MSLYYYARIVKVMYLEKPDGEPSPLSLSPAYATLLTVLMAATVVLGVWWTPLIRAVESSSSLLP